MGKMTTQEKNADAKKDRHAVYSLIRVRAKVVGESEARDELGKLTIEHIETHQGLKYKVIKRGDTPVLIFYLSDAVDFRRSLIQNHGAK